jgi:hypothetical protein
MASDILSRRVAWGARHDTSRAFDAAACSLLGAPLLIAFRWRHRAVLLERGDG